MSIARVAVTELKWNPGFNPQLKIQSVIEFKMEDGSSVFRADPENSVMVETSSEVAHGILALMESISKRKAPARSRAVILKLELDEESMESQFKKEV
jgi:hypothetical protein